MNHHNHVDQGFKPYAEWGYRLLELIFALMPVAAIAYVDLAQPAEAVFEDHFLHEIAIGLATLSGILVSYVSWRCYRQSGEIFVKWLTIGFMGFTVIYSLHGFLTPVAHHNIWLFILYGPVSRLFMAVCLLVAIVRFGQPADSIRERSRSSYWGGWLLAFLIINVGVALLAYSPLASDAQIRLLLEGGAVVLNGLGFMVMFLRGYRSPLMSFYGLALFWFSFSSISFLLARPWNHQWWLAHGIFATGFFLLAYGVLRAYLTTQSFERVFTSRELFEDLSLTNKQLQNTLVSLEATNQQLTADLTISESALNQFRTFFLASPDGIVVVDEHGTIVHSNPRAEALFGYPDKGLVGLEVETLIPQRLRHNHLRDRRLRQYSNVTRSMGSINKPLECLRSDGSIFQAAISISSLFIEGRQCAVTFIRDISGLIKLEEERILADREALLRGRILEQVVAQSPMLVFQFCRLPDGRYCFPYLGGRFADVFGITPETVRNDATAWLASVAPRHFAGFITAIELSAAQHQPWETLCDFTLPSGDTLTCEIRASIPELEPDGSMLWTGSIRYGKD